MSKKTLTSKILPLFIVILGITIFIIYNNLLNRKFIQTEVNSKIIKRNNLQLRTTEFYLKNGLRIDSTYKNKFDLKIRRFYFKRIKYSFFYCLQERKWEV